MSLWELDVKKTHEWRAACQQVYAQSRGRRVNKMGCGRKDDKWMSDRTFKTKTPAVAYWRYPCFLSVSCSPLSHRWYLHRSAFSPLAFPATIGGSIGLLYFFLLLSMNILWAIALMRCQHMEHFWHEIKLHLMTSIADLTKAAELLLLLIYLSTSLNIDRYIWVTMFHGYCKPSGLYIFQAVFFNVKYFCRKTNKDSEWFSWLMMVALMCGERNYIEYSVLSLSVYWFSATKNQPMLEDRWR